jgi:amino acid permease
MYSAVGTSGYLLFGASTDANVINAFGKKIIGGSGSGGNVTGILNTT